MGRPPAYSAEAKARIVLVILSGQTSAARAAQEYGVSQTAIGNWKRQFLDTARESLATGTTAQHLESLEELRTENETLNRQLREATLLAQVWQMSAHARGAGPTTDPSA